MQVTHCMYNVNEMTCVYTVYIYDMHLYSICIQALRLMQVTHCMYNINAMTCMYTEYIYDMHSYSDSTRSNLYTCMSLYIRCVTCMRRSGTVMYICVCVCVCERERERERQIERKRQCVCVFVCVFVCIVHTYTLPNYMLQNLQELYIRYVVIELGITLLSNQTQIC